MGQLLRDGRQEAEGKRRDGGGRRTRSHGRGLDRFSSVRKKAPIPCKELGGTR
jgi:hypothetical protein